MLVRSSGLGSFGIELSGGPGLMAIGRSIVVDPTPSLNFLLGQAGRVASFGPKRGRH